MCLQMLPLLAVASAGVTAISAIKTAKDANRDRKKLAAEQEERADSAKAAADLELRSERSETYKTRRRAAAASPAQASAGLFSPRSFFRV